MHFPHNKKSRSSFAMLSIVASIEYFVYFQNILGTTRKDFSVSWFEFVFYVCLNIQESKNLFSVEFWQKLPSLTIHDCRPCDRWLPAHEVDLFVWVCKREKFWSQILVRAAVFRAVTAKAPQPAVRLSTNHSSPVLWPTNGKAKVMFGTKQL